MHLLILDGESFFTPKVVRSLAQTGRWQLHVLARRTQARQPGLRWSRHVSSYHVADDGDYFAAVDRVVRSTGASLILPVTEPTVLWTIQHQDALRRLAHVVPVPAGEHFETAIDKGRLAVLLAHTGIPHPRTVLATDPAAGALRFPLLVKPRRSCNGHGIAKVHNREELDAALHGLSDIADFCVQEYIEGEDHGCSILARDGEVLAWTTQRGLRRARPFATHVEIGIEEHRPVLEVARRLLRELKWSGVANIDFRVETGTGRSLVLEVNGRYWASLLASTAAGVNFPDLQVRTALGERIVFPQSRSGRFVQPRAYGRDLLRLHPRLLRRQWTDFWDLLADPLPGLMARASSL